VFLPVAEALGSRLAAAIGIVGDLPTRLRRAGRPQTAAEFRVRQFTGALVALAATGVALLALHPGPLAALLALAGAPVLAALHQEHRLDREAGAHQQAITTELPVVAEQLGIMLAAGYSLPSALNRLSRRSRGVVASDLTQVVRRIRHGLSELEALREWAALVDTDGVDRLVGVLALHREASDLGALISEEAKAIRGEAHRQLIESIERRGQLVWVPVTVATLVPGLVLLAVPFVAAMGKVTGG
jgi:tight adherence protein C